MYVHSIHAGQTSPLAGPHATRDSAVRGPSDSGNAAPAANEQDSVSVSSELSGLLTRLEDVPDVRESVVNEAVIRLVQGDYSSRQSAEQTAAAILGAK